MVGPKLYIYFAPREESELAVHSRARLLELLDALRDQEFVSQEEFDLLWMATEKQLIVEGALRALRRLDAYHDRRGMKNRDSFDWTDDKAVFKEDPWTTRR